MLIFSRLKLYLAGIGGFILLLLGAWYKGKQSAKEDQQIEANKDYIKTRERMDEVSRPTDANSARDWLRKRGE
jgi:hypothetical protein